MHRKISMNVLLVFILLGAFPISGFSQNVIDTQALDQTTTDITGYAELIGQIKDEKKQSKGTEVQALAKQLLLTQNTYRELLWQFVDDLDQIEKKEGVEQYTQFISSHLLRESAALKKEIEKGLADLADLEGQIISGKYNFSIAGKAKVSALKARLTKKQKALEKSYAALVKNARKINKIGKDPSQDLSFAQPLVKRQANVLSGLLGFDQDKLAVLERKLSVVSSESKSGTELLSEIRTQNLLIQSDAKRLQKMAELLEDMDLDASLYKKTVIQSSNKLSSSIFDRKVASHLFTEWWLEAKKWFSIQALEILEKTVTFVIIILLAFFVAILVRKMMRRIFKRTLPEMTELAKNFIISMSSKLVILAGILLALSNIGVQIGPLLAGLGIMGFIVGFALQDTLSNFASGLMILIYRPYDVGDKIKSAGVKGKVSKMNLVSTTIYTSENHQLTVPNKKIWGDIIHNVTSQPLQRVDLYFKVPFSAESETVRTAITDVVENCPKVIHDKEKSVRIHELGEADVKYLARFWVATEDLNESQWTISEGVKKRFDEEGISLTIIENTKS